MTPNERLRIAVFIDFDNIEIGVKNTLNAAFDAGLVLDALKERGDVVSKMAYSDWQRAGGYSRALSQYAIRMVQRNLTPGGDKNGADINLALDALEMAFTHSHINAFVIVGGDSDFITLVEKLKQYDRKVFVVGGRAFTSQVMQKNCTEFIAYENVVPDRPSRQPRQEKGERPRSSSAAAAGSSSGKQSIEQAVPLVKRALQVLTDREVSPQLGLLKSTLLQLDSSFSERDYGVSTFREFADKLAKEGLVALKHQGRSTLVELPGGESSAPIAESELVPARAAVAGANSEPASLTELLEQPDSLPTQPLNHDASLGDGVALVRRLLGEATTPPRWPMYPRQFKQFLKNAQPDFDERRYGSIADLMRACQKDGLLRLERDRQGALRVFASGGGPRATVPHGWGLEKRGDGADAAAETSPVVDAVAEVVAPEVVDAQVAEVIDDAPAPKAKRPARARKTAAAGEKKKAAPRKKKAE
ncbi:MAG: NYN domain-containing protein [Vicinamibacterales bacterium]